MPKPTLDLPPLSSASLPLAALAAAATLLAAAVGGSYAYFDLGLNRMGASASMIGLNAAMPALGWLLATPLMPWALRRLPVRGLLAGLALVAVVTPAAFPLWPEPTVWLGLRFLFGGSTGLLFRLIEYWINATAPARHRARDIGIYSTAFCVGAMSGALLIPGIGLDGWPPVLAIAGLALAAGLTLATRRGGPPALAAPPRADWTHLAGPVFPALCGALLFGLFEAVPYTLMPVHGVRIGLSEILAAETAAAFLFGVLLFSVPGGLLADRFGKTRVLAVCGAIGLVIPAVLPLAFARPEPLLAAMVVWGAAAGTLYNVALASLADRCHGSQLAGANAAFGTCYAFGSLCGPLLHGAAIDGLGPQALMVSAALPFLLLLATLPFHPRRNEAER